MDYTKLAGVVSAVTDSAKQEIKKETIVDSAKEERRKAVRDAVRRARLNRSKKASSKIKDSKKYANFKVLDAYVSLRKKIKDELEDTETTEEAINVVIENLEDAPAEQVLGAVVEILGETIDLLQEASEETGSDEEKLDEIEEALDAPAEEEVTEEISEETVEDSAKVSDSTKSTTESK